MHRYTALLPALLLCLCVAGCGDDGPPKNTKGAAAADSKDAAAQGVIEQLLGLVAEGKPAEVANLIAYRGREDMARRWKAPSDYTKEAEKRAVDGVVARIAKLLRAGPPTFVRFESETESEGEWLVWHVRFGTGDDAPKAAFACIKNGEHLLLGDIDNE